MLRGHRGRLAYGRRGLLQPHNAPQLNSIEDRPGYTWGCEPQCHRTATRHTQRPPPPGPRATEPRHQRTPHTNTPPGELRGCRGFVSNCVRGSVPLAEGCGAVQTCASRSQRLGGAGRGGITVVIRPVLENPRRMLDGCKTHVRRM